MYVLIMSLAYNNDYDILIFIPIDTTQMLLIFQVNSTIRNNYVDYCASLNKRKQSKWGNYIVLSIETQTN